MLREELQLSDALLGEGINALDHGCQTHKTYCSGVEHLSVIRVTVVGLSFAQTLCSNSSWHSARKGESNFGCRAQSRNVLQC